MSFIKDHSVITLVLKFQNISVIGFFKRWNHFLLRPAVEHPRLRHPRQDGPNLRRADRERRSVPEEGERQREWSVGNKAPFYVLETMNSIFCQNTHFPIRKKLFRRNRVCFLWGSQWKVCECVGPKKLGPSESSDTPFENGGGVCKHITFLKVGGL